jgi:hypothetical protein
LRLKSADARADVRRPPRVADRGDTEDEADDQKRVRAAAELRRPRKMLGYG